MLKPEQYNAIEWLAQPKHGGKTYDEIAELCGVSRQTLWQWRRSEEFQTEMKREVVRYTSDRLGDVMNAMVNSAITLNSAAAAKLIMEANGMLSSKIELTTKPEQAVDIETLRKRIEALKIGVCKPVMNTENCDDI